MSKNSKTSNKSWGQRYASGEGRYKKEYKSGNAASRQITKSEKPSKK